jgi:hypothetical protein
LKVGIAFYKIGFSKLGKEENDLPKSKTDQKVINILPNVRKPDFFCRFFVKNEKSLSVDFLKGLSL